jgi:hypothetical protein
MLRVFHITGSFLAMYAVLAMLPALYAAVTVDKASFIVFLEVALLYGFFGILLLLGINHKGQQVSHVESCALVVIVFALGAIFAADRKSVV